MQGLFRSQRAAAERKEAQASLLASARSGTPGAMLSRAVAAQGNARAMSELRDQLQVRRDRGQSEWGVSLHASALTRGPARPPAVRSFAHSRSNARSRCPRSS